MNEKLEQRLKKFRDDRNWAKFHTNENLAKAISIEASELLELFLWKDNDDKEKLADEIADIAMFLQYLAMQNGIDIDYEIDKKISKNESRFPVDKNQGVVKRYDK